MNDNLVSVIVPIYNGESFLENCVSSIQTFLGGYAEIILINDGSTDNSKNVCLELKSKYNNIIFIDSENFGVSSARNLGIEKATGKWIMFVDCDDTLESIKCPSYIIDKLNACEEELIVFGLKRDYYKNSVLCDSVQKTFDAFKDITSNKILSIRVKSNVLTLFDNDVYDSSIGRFYKADIVKTNNISFASGVISREDTDFVLDYLLKSESILLLNEYFYHYRIENDETYSFRREMPINDLKILINKYDDFLNYSDSDFEARQKINYFLYQVLLDGTIHYASENYNRSFVDLYNYLKSARNQKAISNIMKAVNVKTKSIFNKLFVYLFNNRCIFVLSLICRLKFKDL